MSYYKKDDKVLALLTISDVDERQSNMGLPYKLRTEDKSDVWVAEDEIITKFNMFTDKDEWENPVSYDEMMYLQGLFSQVNMIVDDVDQMKKQALISGRDTKCNNPKSWKHLVYKLRLAQQILLQVEESITSNQDMGYEVVEDED